MFPSSAAMLKNLQQRAAASNFLMENLLQSKTVSGTDIRLTLNWAANLVACQREKDAEYSRLEREMMIGGNADVGNVERVQHHRMQDHSEISERGSIDIGLAGGTIKLETSGDGQVRNNHAKHAIGVTGVDLRNEDRNDPLTGRFSLKRSSSGEIYADTKRFKLNNTIVRTSDNQVGHVERTDNRSNSAMESINSLDEIDGTSVGDREPPSVAPPDVDRSDSMVSVNVDHRSTSCWIANSMDGRFADFADGSRGIDRVNSISDEIHQSQQHQHHRHHHQQQQQQQQQEQQQHNGRSPKSHMIKTENSRIADEETCTCDEEQCSGVGDCNGRKIREMEKPELKFGVRRILADDHNMRRKPDEILCGRSVGVLPGFPHNLQQNPGAYVMAKPIARPTAYHPHHPTPQHHFPTNTHTFVFGRSPYITVSDLGGGGHHTALPPNTGGSLPDGMPSGMRELAPFGPVFPWSLSPRGRPRKGMMRRAVFSDTQRKGLEKQFVRQKYISKPERKKLADKLGLKDSQVKIWFQNRRMKWRNQKERHLLANGGSREQTLPNKNNPHPDLSDVDGDPSGKDRDDTSPIESQERSSDNEDDEEINVT